MVLLDLKMCAFDLKLCSVDHILCKSIYVVVYSIKCDPYYTTKERIKYDIQAVNIFFMSG